MTALTVATYYGHAHILQTLLLCGANVDYADDEGCTALHEAAGEGHAMCVWILLNHELGPNVNARDVDDDTPLINAAASGHATIVAQLIQHGAVLDIRNRHGMSALDVCMNTECWEELKLGPGFGDMRLA